MKGYFLFGKKQYRAFPGDFGAPVIGHLPEFLADVREMLLKYRGRYGNIFVWHVIRPAVVLLGANANEFVLNSSQKHFSAAQAWEITIGKLFAGGLLNRDGIDHRRHRRMMQPAFRKEALRRYLIDAEPIIDNTIARWPTDHPDIYPDIKQLTMNIALQVFFGISDPSQAKLFNKLLVDIVAGSIAFNKVPIIGRTYHRAMQARRMLIQLLLPIAEHRRVEATEDLFGRLCQAKSQDGEMLTNEEIIDQLLFLMMAAHDTTASSLTSMIYYLTTHPEWQHELYADSAKIDASGIPFENVPEELNFAHRAIKEALRLCPPLGIIPRIATANLEFQGYKIQPNTLIVLAPVATHVMEDYWDKPHEFNPDRFLNSRPNHDFAYIPFGRGVHSCLGQIFAEKSIALVLHKILLYREMSSPMAGKLKFMRVPISVPKGKFPVKLRKRKPSDISRSA